MKRNIRTVVVLGASGTIGSLTGGLLAQNDLDVCFLSRTQEGSLKGLEKAQAQARSDVIGKRITCADYESMMADACAQADWIIECVAEDLSIKKSLYEKVDAYRKQDCVVSSVTSSLPLEELRVGRSAAFQEHFLSTHFYNPPGKMLACEITGHSQTKPSVVDQMAQFLETRLRRVVIPVKPTVAFAGNRIAFLLFARITELAIEHGVEMMDYLIGPYTGRLMAPLATIDLVGLDIHIAIIRSLQKNTCDAMNEKLVVPDYLDTLIQMGCLGRKSRYRGGFYKRLESGQYTFLDPKSCDYVQAFEPHVAFVEKAKSHIHLGMYKKAFETIAGARGPEAKIVQEILALYLSYSYMLIGQVTDEQYGIECIDRVMTAGFNWAAPSMIVNMLGGKDQAIDLIESTGIPVPDGLQNDPCVQLDCFNAGKYFIAR